MQCPGLLVSASPACPQVLCPASPSCLLREELWCFLLMLQSGSSHSLPLYRGNSTEPCGFKRKEMSKLCGWCGLVRILFLFLLRKQLALVLPFHLCYLEWVCPFSLGQHSATVLCSCLFLLEVFHQTWHTAARGFFCISEGNGAYPLPRSLGCLASLFLEL